MRCAPRPSSTAGHFSGSSPEFVGEFSRTRSQARDTPSRATRRFGLRELKGLWLAVTGECGDLKRRSDLKHPTPPTGCSAPADAGQASYDSRSWNRLRSLTPRDTEDASLVGGACATCSLRGIEADALGCAECLVPAVRDERLWTAPHPEPFHFSKGPEGASERATYICPFGVSPESPEP
jgi:hypothetical protein